MRIKYILPTLWILFAIVGRLIPHPANITPLTSLCFFSGMQWSVKKSLSFTLITLILSDLTLSILYDYPLYGSWSFFAYSGFMAITLLGHFAKKCGKIFLMPIILFCSLFFWILTNFGVWFCGDFYAKDTNGLLICYYMALPFLRNAVIGDGIWAVIVFLSLIPASFPRKLPCKM